MVCKNCGTELEEGAKICSTCGLRVEETVETFTEIKRGRVELELEEEIVEETTETDDVAKLQVEEMEEKSITEFVRTVEQKPDEKPSKTKWIALAGALVAVVVMVALVLCNIQVVTNSINKLLLSPEKYYVKVEQKALKSMVADAVYAYGNALEKNTNLTDQTIEYGVDLELSEEAYTILASTLGIEDGKGLAKMGLDFETSRKDDMVSLEIAALLGEDTLISAKGMMDMESAMVCGQIPELSDTYIGMDITEYKDALQEMTKLSEESLELYPKKDALENVINRYSAIILEHINEVTETNEKIMLENMEQKCTILRIDLYDTDIANMIEALAKEAKTDQELESIIVPFIMYINSVDEAQAKVKYIDDLDNLLEDIEIVKANASETFMVRMLVYVNNKGEIIGREIATKDTGISYMRLEKGSKFASEAGVKVMEEDIDIAILGTGEKKASSLSGDFELKIDGIKMADIIVKEWDTKKAMQGLPTGSFRFQPTMSFYSELDMDAAYLLLSNYAIDVEMNTTDTEVMLALALMNQDKMFAKMIMDTKIGAGKTEVLPKNVIMAETEEDIIEWVKTIDFQQFREKLTTSNLPKEYVSMLEEYLNTFEMLMSFY